MPNSPTASGGGGGTEALLLLLLEAADRRRPRGPRPATAARRRPHPLHPQRGVPARAHRRGGILAAEGPGRRAGNPPFWAVKRPVRPYKSAIQTRLTVGNAKGV
jgi:hypothetical protein